MTAPDGQIQMSSLKAKLHLLCHRRRSLQQHQALQLRSPARNQRYEGSVNKEKGTYRIENVYAEDVFGNHGWKEISGYQLEL